MLAIAPQGGGQCLGNIKIVGGVNLFCFVQNIMYLFAGSVDPVTFGFPEFIDAIQQRYETNHAVAIMFRNIGCGKERVQGRSQKQSQGPAATSGHDLAGLHVGRVDIRSLFPVNLDGDIVFVQYCGNGRIRK